MAALQAELATPCTWTLKISLNEDLRRLPGWPQGGSRPTLEALDAACRELFSLGAQEGLWIKYVDDEGDLCTLTQATLLDALALARNNGGVLRLVLALANAPAASAGAAMAGGPGLSRPLLGRLSADRAREAAPSRLAQARPLVRQGLRHFRERVAGDFRSNQRDMREAFNGGASLQPSNVSAAAGCLAGVIVVAKMVPVRALKLAVRSVVAIYKPEHVEVELAPAEPREEIVEASETASWSVLSPADQDRGSAGEELSHFKSQVGQDFDTARGEVMAAITYVTGPLDPSQCAGRPTAAARAVASSRALQGVVTMVTVLAGACVAGRLLPLRAARLAVATATAKAPSGGHSGPLPAVQEAPIGAAEPAGAL